MNKKGVTLLELIIVFVIIAIMSAFIVPGIGSSWLPRYRLRSATRDIVSTMRTAQMRAVSSGNPYQVNFNVGTNSYVLQYTSLGTTFYAGSVQTAPSGITVTVTGLPGNTATFNPNSTCSTCPNGTDIVTLSYQKKGVTAEQKGIAVNPATGRITIQ